MAHKNYKEHYKKLQKKTDRQTEEHTTYNTHTYTHTHTLKKEITKCEIHADKLIIMSVNTTTKSDLCAMHHIT